MRKSTQTLIASALLISGLLAGHAVYAEEQGNSQDSMMGPGMMSQGNMMNMMGHMNQRMEQMSQMMEQMSQMMENCNTRMEAMKKARGSEGAGEQHHKDAPK